MHYGVKGMKWGVRRDKPRSSRARARQKKKEAKALKKEQRKWDIYVGMHWTEAYNKAADYSNRVLIPQINKEYKEKWGEYSKFTKEQKRAIDEDYAQRFEHIYQKEFDKMFGKRPGSR